MQKVFWNGRKNQLTVPPSWSFVKDGETVCDGDKFFNFKTHSWATVENAGIATVGPMNDFEVVIRKVRHYSKATVEDNPNMEKELDCL